MPGQSIFFASPFGRIQESSSGRAPRKGSCHECPHVSDSAANNPGCNSPESHSFESIRINLSRVSTQKNG
ncbi:hypothetical protein PJE062_462 [Pseudovibrio sp. JE062]|nr:hypothetical protein PJE062_462 [Pseudovibrio sp. JE062]